jgi:predicted nucleic acid-binding protein
MVLDFGFKTPERARAGSPEYDVVARVAMSLAHAKTMVPLIAAQIAQYEQKVGPITAPGFEEFSSE